MTLSTLSRRLAVSSGLYSSVVIKLNPALEESPRQANLIGLMVVGYTELELGFAHAAGLALGLKWEVLNALEKVYSETGKIKIIHALAKGAFEKLKLGEEYHVAREMISHCAVLRNQYAHCHYARNYARKRLEFMDETDLFKNYEITPSMLKPITLKLLREQLDYFAGTRRWILWLEITVQERRASEPDSLDKPPRMQQPPRNSSPPPPPHAPGKKAPGGKPSKQSAK